MIKNLKVSSGNIQLLKGGTLKITIPNTNISLINFKSNQEEYDSLYSSMGCTTINVIGTCNINEFNGKTSPQLFIEDFEIVNKQEYYF